MDGLLGVAGIIIHSYEMDHSLIPCVKRTSKFIGFRFGIWESHGFYGIGMATMMVILGVMVCYWVYNGSIGLIKGQLSIMVSE